MPSKSAITISAVSIGLLAGAVFGYPLYASNQYSAAEAEGIARFNKQYPELKLHSVESSTGYLSSNSRYIMNLDFPEAEFSVCVQISSTVEHNSVNLLKGELWRSNFSVDPETGTDCSLSKMLRELSADDAFTKAIAERVGSQPLFVGHASRRLAGSTYLTGETSLIQVDLPGSESLLMEPVEVDLVMPHDDAVTGTFQIGRFSAGLEDNGAILFAGGEAAVDMLKPFPEDAGLDEIWTGTSSLAINDIEVMQSANEKFASVGRLDITGAASLEGGMLSVGTGMTATGLVVAGNDLGEFGYDLGFDNLDAVSYNALTKTIDSMESTEDFTNPQGLAELELQVVDLLKQARFELVDLHHVVDGAAARAQGTLGVTELRGLKELMSNPNATIDHVDASLSVTIEEAYLERMPPIVVSLMDSVPLEQRDAVVEGMRQQITENLDQLEAQGLVQRDSDNNLFTELTLKDGTPYVNGTDASGMIGQ